MRRWPVACLVLGISVSTVGASCRPTASEPTHPTFSRDVAKIVYQRCTPCHRPDDAAPFPFMSYRDVKEHADQIGDVIDSGFMPPWLPSPDVSKFVGDRSLSPRETRILRRWVADGAPQGDPAAAPDPPDLVHGWTLGQPDMVLSMEDAYQVPAGGPDVFRTFVLRVPIDKTVYVKQAELRPDNPELLHHANFFIDRTGTARHLDEQDDEPGFPGMEIKEARPPRGQFLAWTPGKRQIGSPLSSWRLDPGTDIVMQAHIQPSGKVAPVRPRLGLYFTDEPPQPNLEAVVLYSRGIDIPAGARNHRVAFNYTLPVDLESVTVFPHAHFLCRKVDVYATLPDGSRRGLIRIDEWDFNWQDEYTHTEPVSLPKGSVVHLEFTYDNSEHNEQNPNLPPVRVVAGEASSDEMANFFWQVRTKSPQDATKLRYDVERTFVRKEMADLERLVKTVRRAELELTLGAYYERFTRIDEAIAAYRRAIDIDPDFAFAHNNLAVALIKKGQAQKALEVLEHVHTLIGCAHEGDVRGVGSAEVHNNLANAYTVLQKPAQALEHYEWAIRFWPEYADAYFNAGNLYLRQGQAKAAAERYRQALKTKPRAANVHTNLAIALSMTGDGDGALMHFERSASLRPTARARFNLGRAYEAAGRPKAAVKAYRGALDLDPNYGAAKARFNALTQ